MAYESKATPGRRFANHAVGRNYDRVKANPVAEKEAEQEPADDGQGEQPIEQVVAEHGPAHTTHIMRHPDDSHSVTSEHEDGHKHESHGHPDVHEAHRHSLKAHGASDEEESRDDGGRDEQPSMIASELEG